MTKEQKFEYIMRVQQIIEFIRNQAKNCSDSSLRANLQRYSQHLEDDLIEFFGACKPYVKAQPFVEKTKK